MTDDELLEAELEAAYVQGREAALEGAERTCNPYQSPSPELAIAWDDGFLAALAEGLEDA